MIDPAVGGAWKDLSMDRMAGIRARIKEVVERAVDAGLASSVRDFSVRARLGKGHVRDIVNGVMDPRLRTLERIADFAGVSLEYLVFGQDQMPPRSIAAEVNDHPSPAFGPAARAYLELHRFSAEAVTLVRAMMSATFNPTHEWTPEEWFEELAAEHKRRARAVRQRSA